jgi:large subunit ribosomal protein L18
MRTQKKQLLAARRRWRIRRKIKGSSARPRMSVRFTGQHIYVQFVDDEAGRTLAAATTRTKKGVSTDPVLKANVEGAKRVGVVAADVAKAAGIAEVVFDRSGARYHGKVKALADAAREGGLKF